jgi:hypothetical protein
MCKHYAILYKGLEHLQILESEGGSGTDLLWIWQDEIVPWCSETTVGFPWGLGSKVSKCSKNHPQVT